MPSLFRYMLSCAALLLALAAQSAVAAGLFEGDSLLEVRLQGPIRSLLKDTERRRERPVILRTAGHEFTINARVRGKSRARHCEFPPLRLDFRGADTAGTVFDGQGKIKLVTHCRNSRDGSGNVLEEFAAYRIFNVLSAVGYRVRLLRVNYADSAARLPKYARSNYAFVIEPAAQLEARLGGDWATLPGVRLSQLDTQQAARMFVFQYLIGNTDWSLVAPEIESLCCHNVDLLGVEGRLFPVPFDFDLSGLVDAAYAKPDPSLRIRRVTQRRYRGYCVDSAAVDAALAHTANKRDEILAVLAGLPGYVAQDLDKASAYLGQFFRRAKDRDTLLAYFQDRCLR